MADLLIRDVPDEVMASLDAHARQLGISRDEYVRRRLMADAAPPVVPVQVTDLVRCSELFSDLGDQNVMERASR